MRAFRLLLLFFVPLSVFAQQPPTQPYTLKATTRLIILDVVVTDANREVVSGLGREDFKVTEAGEPQTILNFETAGTQTPSAAIDVKSTADLERLAPRAPVNIIVFDEFSIKFEDRAFARYSLKKFLSSQPEKLDTPTLLLAVDLKKLYVLRDYTQSKTEIINALDHHLAEFPYGTQGSITWAAGTYGNAIATLTRVAQASIGHQGHKNLVWIGRGFPPLSQREMSADQESRTNSLVQEAINSLRDARITLYTVDPTGLLGLPGYTNGLLIDVNGGNYQFNRLAIATGGSALFGRNDVDAEIGRSIRSGSSFYTLSYRPTTETMDPQKFRKIHVEVNRPGFTVSTRTGYFVEKPVQRVDLEAPRRKLVADMLLADNSRLVYSAIPVTLTPVPKSPLKLGVSIAPTPGIVWTDATDTEPRGVDVILLGSTYDKGGKEITRVVKSFHVQAPKSAVPQGPLEQKIDLALTLDPNPRAVRARVVVRIGSTGRIGTADIVLPHSNLW